ncbi:spore germination protein [Effusibacillus consociatus]|uniref:Spore germination protein n=1 Tax=Effusibacillus consociatus TaxID=1117041 RepID=A0ABV9PXS8_9BACL
MPSFIAGPIKINSVATGATILFGDTLFVAPKTATKSYSGSGGGANGDFSVQNNFISSTNTIDSDLMDDTLTSGT